MTEELLESERTAANESAKGSFELSTVVVALLKGVIEHEKDPKVWNSLINLQIRVRDYVSVLGLELVLDESEGYAFLRSTTQSIEGSDATTPRLMARRPLSFPVSLLLALLRKKLVEFDAHGGDTRLILSREDIVQMLQVFLPESTNEAKLINQVDTHLKKVEDLGFLRRLKTQSSRTDSFEVRRILKAFVDAQWLADLDLKLAEYQKHAAGSDGASSVGDGDE